MVLHLGAEAGAQHFLGHGETDGGRDPLTQRTGRRLDPLGVAVFRVTGGLGAPLTEVPDLLDRHVAVAGEVQKRVDQHRAMACRQDKPVAVRPVGAGGVEFQVLLEEHRGHVCHAHRHPRMARVRGLHRVDGQHPDGGGLHPMVGVFFAKGGNVHGADPLTVSAKSGSS